jgi:hypothetical protein
MAAVLQALRSGATQIPEEMVNALDTALVRLSGVLSCSANHFLVEQSDSLGMTVDVRQGYAFIVNSANSMTYPVRLKTEDAQVSITANSSGNSRIDAIVLYIDLGASANAEGTNVATLIAVEGTAAASPSAPTDANISTAIGAANPFLRLANVTVASGETEIEDAHINDKRVDAFYGRATSESFETQENLYRQILINGNMDIWQINTTFTTPNDDTYLADQWNCIQEANSAWTFTRSTDAPAGSSYSLKAVNVTANKQCGIVQFIENIDAAKLASKYVSLSFQAKTTNAKVIDNVRATVLSWDSTADTVTSDVVGTWAGSGTDPTWAANWTAEKAGFNHALTTSWTKYEVNNIYIDTASMANIAVVIWIDDDTITANDELFVSQVQLNVGSKAMDFKPKTFDYELFRSIRFYQKSYEYGTFAGAATSDGQYFVTTSTDSGGNAYLLVSFAVQMHKIPTMKFYAVDGSADVWGYARNGATATGTVSSHGTPSTKIFQGYFPTGGNWVVCYIQGQWTATAQL